jgi:hypothetical protein
MNATKKNQYTHSNFIEHDTFKIHLHTHTHTHTHTHKEKVGHFPVTVTGKTIERRKITHVRSKATKIKSFKGNGTKFVTLQVLVMKKASNWRYLFLMSANLDVIILNVT